MLEDKIRNVFSDMVVLKNPKRTEFFSNLSLPSYMRDWLVMKFSDKNGNIDSDSVLRYIKQYIPSREDFEQIKYQMVIGESIRFLARLRVSVNIKNGKTEFELPDFGGAKSGAGGEIRNDVVDKWQDVLLHENENWGILELTWCRDFSSKQAKGIITLIGYTPFCPYTVDLDFYREARKQFTIQEWIDVLISAADYNPNGYDNEIQKLFFLRRLLPFVERRVNIIELAPKGTGKSYVYQKISKRGWLIAGGTVSRATLIYDNAKKMGGLITRFDFVAFDEIQTMTFEQPSQIQTALKHYMEFGEIKGFDAQMAADAGIVVLGNIDAEKFDTSANMVEAINPIFRESATLDRFHGVIPGWEIPRLNQDLIADGWAINTEYFAEVLHGLREELIYSTIIDECLDIPAKADQRDLTAIKRLCSAFLKLLFPHASCKEDIPPDEFIKYCLVPAKEMRGVIKKQLCVVDPGEFNVPSKRDIPDIQYRF
jgi:ATP-dependent Lon protease